MFNLSDLLPGTYRLRVEPSGFSSQKRHWYRSLIEECLQKLTPGNLAVAIEIANLPDQIRGYEKIKSDSIGLVKARAAEKLAQMSLVQIPVLK